LGRPELGGQIFVDGWFRTGDRVAFSGDHLVWVGEKKRTRKVNGNIVDLLEVQDAITSFQGITDAQVTLDPNGKIVAALTSGQGEDLQTVIPRLREFLRGALALYKLPRTFRQKE
jgi:acyl-CoA synthetase (AMP-forming)/AMP-acid ligase II